MTVPTIEFQKTKTKMGRKDERIEVVYISLAHVLVLCIEFSILKKH